MMGTIRGGTWSVGTRDNAAVYIERYDLDHNLVFSAIIDPDEAREIGQALLNKANVIDAQEE